MPTRAIRFPLRGKAASSQTLGMLIYMLHISTLSSRSFTLAAQLLRVIEITHEALVNDVPVTKRLVPRSIVFYGNAVNCQMFTFIAVTCIIKTSPCSGLKRLLMRYVFTDPVASYTFLRFLPRSCAVYSLLTILRPPSGVEEQL